MVKLGEKPYQVPVPWAYSRYSLPSIVKQFYFASPSILRLDVPATWNRSRFPHGKSPLFGQWPPPFATKPRCLSCRHFRLLKCKMINFLYIYLMFRLNINNIPGSSGCFWRQHFHNHQTNKAPISLPVKILHFPLWNSEETKCEL